jgi:predicted NBD/HSP70 family sugar kinase
MTTNGADLARLRRINELAVLATVRAAQGELRLAQIAERTGLARASVGEVVRGLVGNGWLEELDPVVSGRGRPAHRYGFRADAGRVLGLDIGAHNVRVQLADLDGTVLATLRKPTEPGIPRSKRLLAIERAIRDCLKRADATPDRVWATVAGSTGWVDSNGQVLLSASIQDWAGVDLAGRLRTIVDGPVVIDNDSRLAALAEQRRGAGQGVDDLVLLQAGRRTGLGLVIGGKPHRGFGSAAGDLSMHRVLKWESAIEYLLLCKAKPRAGTTGDQIADVLTAAAEEDSDALTAVRRYVRELGIAAAAAISMIDPEVVVLGGSMSAHADLLLPMLAKELEILCMRPPILRGSTLGADSAALGAVCLALEQVDKALLATGTGPLGPLERPASA